MSAMVLFGVTGGAIDYARWYQARDRLQASVDAAVLAGGRTAQTSGAIAALASAQQYFNLMKPADVPAGSVIFTLIENGAVMRGTGTYDFSTPLLGVVGFPSLPINYVSEAELAMGGNAGTSLELSVMLDITGSMAGQKIEDLKLAAKDLVDIVVWSDQSEYTSKVALAPFSARVNVGSFIDKVTDVQAERKFGGNTLKGITCVTDRTGSEALKETAPETGKMLSAYKGDTGNTARKNSDNYSSDGLCKTSAWGAEIPQIMPLTNDKAALLGRIESLPATGTTAGALGTAWAWYLLSPKWSAIWTGASTPSPYSDITTLGPKGLPKLKKVAILMTDGIYNTTGGTSYGDNSDEAVATAGRAVSLCTNMKATGIKVYTVGFDLGGSQLATDTLRSCASREPNDPADHPSYFFNTSTGDELKGAFRQIALQLATLRLRR